MPCKESVGHGHCLPGGHIAQYTDGALAAHGKICHRQSILAGIDIQLVAAAGEQLHHLAHIAAGFLHCGNVGVLRQLFNGGGQHIAAGAGGHIVKDDGAIHAVGDGAVVGQQAAVQGLIVVIIGGDDQKGIRADAAGGLAELHGMQGIVGAGARDHGDPAVYSLHGEADHLIALLGRQGGAFAGGAHGNQSVDSVFQLEVDQPSQRLIVHTGGR